MIGTVTPSGSKTVTVAGGSLYRVALDEYGDALLWTRIAQANGLTDPWLVGVITLTIPRAYGTDPGTGVFVAV